MRPCADERSLKVCLSTELGAMRLTAFMVAPLCPDCSLPLCNALSIYCFGSSVSFSPNDSISLRGDMVRSFLWPLFTCPKQEGI